jgi:hypothetical protein
MHFSIRPSRRLIGAAAGAAGLLILASACASGSSHQASGTGAQPRPTATVAPSPPAPAPSTSRPAPTGSPATGPTGSAGSTPPAYAGPHFTTPQGAIAYLAAAYNSDDTAAMHAVTDAQAFTSLQAMRSSDADFRLVSCTPRQQGDYVCTVRYRGPASSGNQEHGVAMLIAAPALNPGWYMYRFISGCD